MNVNIKKLFSIASKSERQIIGLMSGTSMDGLDIAWCSCSGSGTSSRIKIQNFTTVPFSSEFKEEIKSVFSRRDADLQKVCLLNEQIAITHAEMILDTLKEWNVSPSDFDLIASHGQTIFHAPKQLHGLENYPNATLQIADGDHIAVKTGIITICDFRQKHLAAGGEGAPLAVYGDYLIFSKEGENRIMLNIGGISNFTYLPADLDASNIFSTDIGPGNTMMDQFIQKHYPGMYYDEDSKLARTGKVNFGLLASLLDHEFLRAGFPKSTGPELFNLQYLENAMEKSVQPHLPNEDILATLCKFSADCIVKSILESFSEKDSPVIYMSGGGMHNPLMVEHLKNGVPFARFANTEELNINPDAKEAALFAILANETVAGGPIDFGGRLQVPSVCMGKICLPN
ncbi:anhydro-N-acetylmuramic acid kinase [Daejeonella oryzae]|uniref:anhydro-N-acetylmuramic acid kinase n=1 Tax=Daejeonella oryzae TaxID=1122943 RepID=UPI0003F9EC2B|nr:anhydro-N-acetylmuramic acid kinase [Daejeonella oryzae]